MFEPPGEVKVVGIGGSLREDSCCYLALGHVTDLVTQMGCRARVLDLRRMPLPFCNGDHSEQWNAYPAVAELRKAVREAHAIVLATPEYHGGVSGVLKNALDLLGFEHLEGKVVGIIGVLGGASNSAATNELARIMRHCRAWVLPQQIAIGRAQNTFAGGCISDADLLKRFQQFTHCLVWSAARLCVFRHQRIPA